MITLRGPFAILEAKSPLYLHSMPSMVRINSLRHPHDGKKLAQEHDNSGMDDSGATFDTLDDLCSEISVLMILTRQHGADLPWHIRGLALRFVDHKIYRRAGLVTKFLIGSENKMRGFLGIFPKAQVKII